jgi:hypothetical protein
MEDDMTRTIVTILALAGALCLARPSDAQTSGGPLRIVPDFDDVEIGVDLGAILGENYRNWLLLGGRFTRNFTRWLAAEAALHAGSGEDVVAGRSLGRCSQFTTDARIGGWIENKVLVFGTAGVAGATGLSYGYSPFLGIGVHGREAQRLGGSIGWRAEIQRYIRGPAWGDGHRLTAGIVVGF